MKVFISHKFRGVDPDGLREDLETVAGLLENGGHSTFIYFRDREQWMPQDFPPGEVIKEAFEELKNCDVVLALVKHKAPSEGMLLELGFAKALGKKVTLLISEDCCPTFLEAISDQVIKFDSLEDIGESLSDLAF